MSFFPTSAPPPAHVSEYRRADRLRGLVIVGLTFVLCLLISIWAKRRATPVFSAPPAPPSTVGVVGFPNAVDPIKTLARARQLTPRDLLRTITADNVKSDGTVDVAVPTGHVHYAFQSAVGEGPEAMREPGTLARRPSCGRQSVEIRGNGMFAQVDAPDTICVPHPSDPLPEPHCSFADVWAHAIARGVPKGRVAHIEYYRASAGPAFRFESPHPHGRFSLYGDCKRELEGKDALNISPP